MFGTAYLSKRLDFHPDDLADVAAQWHRGLVPVRWASRMVHVSDGFWLAAEPALGGGEGITVYEASGVVWAAGRPVPVSLEFARWSATRCEVGVGPRHLSWPVGTDRYARRVEAALGEIGRTLCSASRREHVPCEAATTEVSVVADGGADPAPEAVHRGSVGAAV